MGDIPFFNTVTDGDITYYNIPAGTDLFRGDMPRDYTNPLADISGPVFFGQTEEVARIYGLPFRFSTLSEMNLLALDKSMQTIYDNASNDNTPFDNKTVKDVIPKILKENYGYKTGIRNSDDAADKKLTKYICQRFPGYATDFMRTDGEGTFHREIVICNKEQVQFQEKVPISNSDEKSIRDEQASYKLSQQLRSAKQSARKESAEKRSHMKISDTPRLSLWDDDETDIMRSAQKSARKETTEKPSNNYNDFPKMPIWEDDEEDVELTFPVRSGRLFMDETDGGNKPKKRTSNKKRIRSKQRKTHKKGKQQKNTRKKK